MDNAEVEYGIGGDRRMIRRVARRVILGWSVAGLVVGCAAGPDFKRSASPEVAGYTATPLPERTVSAAAPLGAAQHFVSGECTDVRWWRDLGSSRLDALIEQALQSSPTLASAQATLRQAQETYAAWAGSTLYPQVDAGVGAQRQRLNPGSLGQAGDPRAFSLYDAGIDVQYRFDVAGGNRRALEALGARTEHRRYELEAARLTLTANIVTTAINQARLAGQVQATEAMLRAQDEQLHITRERVRLGQAAADEALALQTQVEQTRAGLPLLLKQLQQNEHLLAVLTGRAPGAGGVPAFTLDEFTLPSALPLVLPSELVRRRPDIQAAEALVHAASAEYGIAAAKLYPQLDLSANLGSQALTTGALFGSGSAVWSLVGQLTQPLFNPGLPAEKRAALAAFDAAAANYQGVVLEALRNVADVLRAVENDAQVLAALAIADTAAQGSLESVQRQYALGQASYVQLLIAEQRAQQTKIDLIAAQAERLSDTVALHYAVGGGVGHLGKV